MNPIAGLLFACLVGSGLYVNKYVLSVLGFKYPTIFQGWQTLAGLVIYKLLTYCSKANFKLVGIDRPAFISLLPGFLFFTTSLVAASKALAGKPLPQKIVQWKINLKEFLFRSLWVYTTPSQPPSTSLTEYFPEVDLQLEFCSWARPPWPSWRPPSSSSLRSASTSQTLPTSGWWLGSSAPLLTPFTAGIIIYLLPTYILDNKEQFNNFFAVTMIH